MIDKDIQFIIFERYYDRSMFFEKKIEEKFKGFVTFFLFWLIKTASIATPKLLTRLIGQC